MLVTVVSILLGALALVRAAIQPPEIGVWTALGCYNAVLSTKVPNVHVGTIQACLDICFLDGANGFPFQFGGVRNGTDCLCSMTLQPGSFVLPPSACDLPGEGGIDGAMQLYTLKPGIATKPHVVPSFDGWTSAGCWTDTPAARALRTYIPSDQTIQVQDALNACKSRGFNLAGIEYSHEIYCGNALLGGNTLTAAADSCNFACGGNPSQICGGSNAISVYKVAGSNFTSGPASIPQTIGNWTYALCARDSLSARTVPTSVALNADKLTLEICINACQQAGFTVAAAQYGQECRCGSARLPSETPSEDALCNLGCSGNADELCGGALANQIYYLAVSPNP